MDLISKIFEYLDDCELYNILFNSRQFTIYNFLSLSLFKKIKWIEDNFPAEIINLMGNMEVMLSYPTLVWDNKFMGFTHYIDKVLPNDLISPIMIGKDLYDRSFICIRYECLDKEHSLLFQNPNVITLFQRYSTELNTWTHGSFSSSFIYDSGCFLTRGKIYDEKFTNNIKKLLTNKPVSLELDIMGFTNYFRLV